MFEAFSVDWFSTFCVFVYWENVDIGDESTPVGIQADLRDNMDAKVDGVVAPGVQVVHLEVI